MRTLREAIEDLGRLRQESKIRDALLLQLVGRVKILEDAKSYLTNRPPPIILRFPQSLRDLGMVPLEER